MSLNFKASSKRNSDNSMALSTSLIKTNSLHIASNLYKSSLQLHNITSVKQTHRSIDLGVFNSLEPRGVQPNGTSSNYMLFSDLDYAYIQQSIHQPSTLLSFSTNSNDVTSGGLKHTALVNASNTSTLLELAKQDR